MNIFTQLVYVVGRVTPNHVEMLGSAFLVSRDGHIVTTHHVTGPNDANLVILSPHINNINAYQDLSDNRCSTIPVRVAEIDPIRDLALLKADITWPHQLPKLGSFDDDNVGDEIGIFGFPHCVEGRRTLTYQRAELGAKVLIEVSVSPIALMAPPMIALMAPAKPPESRVSNGVNYSPVFSRFATTFFGLSGAARGVR